MNELLGAAVEYLHAGYGVIPLSPKSKIPPKDFPLATYLHERKATEEEIAKWWAKNPHYNVGVVCGQISGMFVVDVDPRNGGDPATVLLMAPTERISQSGRTDGGCHLWYEYPKDEHIPSGKSLLSGVDIQSDGKYIVAPPSVHPDTGLCYYWQSTGELGYTDNGVKRLFAASEQILAPSTGDRNISKLLHGSSEGNRNDDLIRLAGYFAGKKLPQDVVEVILLQWAQRCKPTPLPEAEARRTIRSAYDMERRKGQDKTRTAGTGLPLLSLGEFMEKYAAQEVSWIVEDWLPDSTVHFVIASPGSYKTWLSFDLAISVATGKQFLGKYPVLSKGPVFLFQQEDYLGGGGGVAGRISAILAARYGISFEADKDDVFRYDLLPNSEDIPLYFHAERSLRFTSADRMKELEEHIIRLHPKLIIVDPLYTTGPLENFMAQITEQMVPLKLLRDTYGCSFVLVHHMTKSQEEGVLALRRARTWGNVFIDAAKETSWDMAMMGDSVLLQRRSKVGPTPKLVRMKFNISTEYPYCYDVEVYDVGDLDELIEVMPGGEDRVDEVIMLALSMGPLPAHAIVQATKLDRTLVLKRLSELKRLGKIISAKGGAYELTS